MIQSLKTLKTIKRNQKMIKIKTKRQTMIQSLLASHKTNKLTLNNLQRISLSKLKIEKTRIILQSLLKRILLLRKKQKVVSKDMQILISSLSLKSSKKEIKVKTRAQHLLITLNMELLKIEINPISKSNLANIKMAIQLDINMIMDKMKEI